MPDYKLYTEWTAWWPFMHPPEGCAAEAADFCQLLHDIHPRPVPDQPQTMVGFGCGGGGNPSYLKTNPHAMRFLAMIMKRMTCAISSRSLIPIRPTPTTPSILASCYAYPTACFSDMA